LYSAFRSEDTEEQTTTKKGNITCMTFPNYMVE